MKTDRIMASASRATSPHEGLGEDDLGDLYEALYPIRHKYKHLGLQMKVKKSEIENIEAQHSDHGDRLLEILTIRVKQTSFLTWTIIEKALRSRSVGEHQLADSIWQTHVKLPSRQNVSDREPELKQYKEGGGQEKAGGKRTFARSYIPLRIDSGKKQALGVRVSGDTRRFERCSDKYPVRKEGTQIRKKPMMTHPVHGTQKKSRLGPKQTQMEIKSKRIARATNPCKLKASDHQTLAEVQSEAVTDKNTEEGTSSSVYQEIRGRSENEHTFESACGQGNKSRKAKDTTIKRLTDEGKHTKVVATNREHGLVCERHVKSKVQRAEKRLPAKTGVVRDIMTSVSTKLVSKALSTPCSTPQYPYKRDIKMARGTLTKSQRTKIGPGIEQSRQCKKLAHSGTDKCSKMHSTKTAKSHEREGVETKAAVQATPEVRRYREGQMQTEQKEIDSCDECFAAANEEEENETSKGTKIKKEMPKCTKKQTQSFKKLSESVQLSNIVDFEREKDSKTHTTTKSSEREREETKAAIHNQVGCFESYDQVRGSDSCDSSHTEDQKSSSNHQCFAVGCEDKASAESRGVRASSSAPEDDDQSNPGGRDGKQESKDIQQRKKLGERHENGSVSSASNMQDRQKLNKQPHCKGQEAKRSDCRQEESSTESDDSSPECDTISESEGKSLRKIFKCFFGRLCLTIRNPVEIAAILQMKGLLTYTVMIELLESPESTQAKAIILVTALQNQIKSHPGKIFPIIQVFLQNEVLEETGKEMWTETGKIFMTSV